MSERVCSVANDDCLGGLVAHHDDYAKPDEIRWLCRGHHMRWHYEHGHAPGWYPGIRLPRVDGTKQIPSSLSATEYAALEAHAEENERSLAAELRLAVRAWLARIEAEKVPA